MKTMGISIAGGGIAVDMAKSYLINLNADPAMNELLVYYLKDTVTRIGTNDAKTKQDIILSGLGICDEHCIIESRDGELYVSPIKSSQVHVNGTVSECNLHTIYSQFMM